MVKTTGRYLFQNDPYNRTLRSKVKNRIFLGRHREGGFCPPPTPKRLKYVIGSRIQILTGPL